MRVRKQLLLLITCLCASLFLSGCGHFFIVGQENLQTTAETVLIANSTAIQNPQAVYKVPPTGIVVKNVLYADESGNWKDTGPIKLIPGSVIVWDAEYVGD